MRRILESNWMLLVWYPLGMLVISVMIFYPLALSAEFIGGGLRGLELFPVSITENFVIPGPVMALLSAGCWIVFGILKKRGYRL